MERSLDAWEGVQRHGQDLADRLVQGFSGLLTSSHTLQWPPAQGNKPFDADFTPIIDIGNRIGQAGAEFGACLNGVVQHFFRHLPLPFRSEDFVPASAAIRAVVDHGRLSATEAVERKGGVSCSIGFSAEDLERQGLVEDSDELAAMDEVGYGLRSAASFAHSQGSINITSTYDSRTNDVESSLVARGDLWRAEASHGGSTSGNESSPLFLIQLGPVLFVRDTTLLFPVHLSKQRLLWYGYDRKNGMHSLCPALWSKHRRWLWMSMICLNPLACSFMDLQFPNGQLTYVAGEGFTTSAFLPIFGGLLQAQGQYPGETRFSFSYKNKWGTRITPTFHWPDKSFSLGLAQGLACKSSGLMLRPTVQFSICPTFGGSNPGLRAELIHTVREKLSLICGGSSTARPSVFASVSIGRSKWNGNAGSVGLVMKVETPVGDFIRPYFSVQLNSGIEF